MSKASERGRGARRTSDVATPIKVVRDGVTTIGTKHPRAAARAHALRDSDARLMRDVSEELRAALVPDRIAEAVARQVEGAAGDRIRVLLRKHLASDLRALLRRNVRNGFVEIDPSDILNEALADTIAAGTAETLVEQFSTALRERLPVAVRAATAHGAFARRLGAGGVDDLADRLSVMAEATIRRDLVASLRSVVRGRLAEVARDDARELLRVAVEPEDGEMSSEDQVASLAEAIETATRERVVRGVVERFRALIASSVHHATGERLGDGLHRSLVPVSRTGGESKPPARPRAPVTPDGLGERLERPVAESIRARLVDGLRERVEATCRENIDEVLRDRLLGAIRVAIAEQRGTENVDAGRLAEVITYELSEVLRARICDGIRARTADAVRTRLAGAIRDGVARASKE